jgi:hypothetical protein
LHKLNAKDESLIREAEMIANGPSVAVSSGEGINLFSAEAIPGLAVVPATPALALAQ